MNRHSQTGEHCAKIMAIPLSECVFCKKEWLLPDIDREKILIGEGAHALDEGVCNSCSADLIELPSKEFDHFSYSKFFLISDIHSAWDEGELTWPREKKVASLLLLALKSRWNLEEEISSQSGSWFRKVRSWLRVADSVSAVIEDGDFDGVLKAINKVTSGINSQIVYGFRTIYRISLKCVLKQKCEGENSEFIYTGIFSDSGFDFPLKEDFPQKFNLAMMTCCGEEQTSSDEEDIYGFFCSHSDKRSHKCKCKEEEFHEDVKESWRAWERGHANRWGRRRREEKEEFEENCEEHGLDVERTRSLLAARYSSLEEHRGPFPGKRFYWLLREDRRCARLEECRIPARGITSVFELPGRMIGSGYICRECYEG
jgi:hypothetical protein